MAKFIYIITTKLKAMKRIFTVFYISIAIIIFSCIDRSEQGKFEDSRPSILKLLDGEWQVQGTWLDESSSAVMKVHPIVKGTFSEINIEFTDSLKSQAKVIVGYDSISKKLIGYWLTSLGAGSSIPHGTGDVYTNSFELTFPYFNEPHWRDVFIYHPESNTWTFKMESNIDSTNWKTFGDYKLLKMK